MAEDKAEPTETDIFKQQEKTIDLLYDVLQNKMTQAVQPTYVTQAAPAEKEAPNYLMYIVIAAAAWLFLKG